MTQENNQEIQSTKPSAFVHKSLTVSASAHQLILSHCKLHNLKVSHWAGETLLAAISQSVLTPKS